MACPYLIKKAAFLAAGWFLMCVRDYANASYLMELIIMLLIIMIERLNIM